MRPAQRPGHEASAAYITSQARIFLVHHSAVILQAGQLPKCCPAFLTHVTFSLWKKTKHWWIPKKILWNKTIHWWIPQKMFPSIMVINGRYILSWVLWLLYMRHKYSAHMEYFKCSCGFHIAMTSTHGPLEILNEIVIDGPCISCKRGLMRLSLDLTDNESTSVWVLAWYRQATCHYLSPYWPWSMSPYGVTRPQWVR